MRVIKKINKPGLTKLQFRNRFSFDELVAIETAAESNPAIRVLQQNLSVADYIDVNDPNTQAGIQYLVLQGLLTAERAAIILV